MNLRKIWPYWGLVVFVVAVTAWITADTGPAGLAVLFALSFVWFLVQAPIPCGASNRRQGEQCRNNARGILRGCRIEAHKWQRARSVFAGQGASRAVAELFPNAVTGLASLGAVVTLLCTLTTTVLTVMKGGGS